MPDPITEPADDITIAGPETANDQAIATPPPADQPATEATPPPADDEPAAQPAAPPAAPPWLSVQLGDDAGYTPSTIHGTLTGDRAIKLNRLVNGFAQQGIVVTHFEALARLLDLI